MTISTRTKRFSFALAALTMASVFSWHYLTAPAVQAIIPEQRKVFLNDVPYFNFADEDVSNGCGQNTAPGGPANLTVGPDFSLGPLGGEEADRARRVNLVRALMADLNLTAEQASGIVGNFMQESGGPGLPPNVNEGGRAGPPAFRGGYGWAQWTGSRQREFIDFAVANSFMASRSVDATDAANYAFLKHELGTSYTSTVRGVKSKNTPEDAAISFENTYERAGRPNLAARTRFARQVFNEYSNGGGGAAPATGANGGAAAGAPCANAGGTGVVGDKAFPLRTNKRGVQNRNIFANNTTNVAGHPYTAYDILAAPGTEVVAFLAGRVTSVSQDRCPGRLISVFNEQANITISYLHLNLDRAKHIGLQGVVNPGDRIGEVGPASAGCGTPHLHIDAAQGARRPGCSRLNCPAANKSKFIDIGPDLFQTYQALPE